jgi:NAD(P)-dependent dehydrogenase (short-subunit alcohol dehydrogenase family)
MSRILVTGSAQGIGAEVARRLLAEGHEVAVHGRSPERAATALDANPGATVALVGAFDNLDSTRAFAADANAAGPWDVIVHNAALGPDQPSRRDTVDGIEQMFHVNVVSPYLLTCLMPVAPRMIYIGSDASQEGGPNLDDVQWTRRAWDGHPWPGLPAYSDSKLYLSMIAIELGTRFPGHAVNIVHPGWVQTSMGGPNAAIPVDQGADTPVWMATSDDALALGSGRFIHRRAEEALNPAAHDPALRARLFDILTALTGETLPSPH